MCDASDKSRLLEADLLLRTAVRGNSPSLSMVLREVNDLLELTSIVAKNVCPEELEAFEKRRTLRLDGERQLRSTIA